MHKYVPDHTRQLNEFSLQKFEYNYNMHYKKTQNKGQSKLFFGMTAVKHQRYKNTSE